MSSSVTGIPGRKVGLVDSGGSHLAQPENTREIRDEKPSSSMQGEADESQTRPATDWKIGRNELLIILSLSIINMVVALDSSIIVTALKTITVDIRADTTQGFWIGTSYLLASTVVMPPVASISTIFGRPLCLFLSLCAFTLGSLLCCVARSVTLLLAGRAVQGMGGGGIWVVSLLLLTDLVPLRHRPKWWAVISLGWAVGLIVGPLIGGALAQHATWRWVFYLNFPFCGFGLAATLWLLPLRQPRAAKGAASLHGNLGRVDWVGGAGFTAALALFLFAITSAGVQFGWDSVQIVVPLVVGFMGLVATGVWEGFYAGEPMLRRSLFSSGSANIAYLGGFIQGIVLYGENYYVPFFFQTLKQSTPVQAGVYLLPVMLFIIPSGAATGALVSRLNNYRYAIWVGWALITVSCGLQLLWQANTPTGVWVTTLILMGLGHGAVLNAQTFACQALAGSRNGEVAAATAMYGFVRQLGSAVGVSVGSATWQNVAARRLDAQGLPRDVAFHAEGYIEQLPRTAAVVDAFTGGFKGVWAVLLGLAGLAFLLGFAIRHVDMHQPGGESRRKVDGGGRPEGI